MILFFFAFGYVIVGTVIGTVASHLTPGYQRDNPEAFFLGVFWPIGIPIAIKVTLTKRALRHVDRWREAREKERRELTERLAELEAELGEKGVFENRRTD